MHYMAHNYMMHQASVFVLLRAPSLNYPSTYRQNRPKTFLIRPVDRPRDKGQKGTWGLAMAVPASWGRLSVRKGVRWKINAGRKRHQPTSTCGKSGRPLRLTQARAGTPYIPPGSLLSPLLLSSSSFLRYWFSRRVASRSKAWYLMQTRR